jgi:hypothetical protein
METKSFSFCWSAHCKQKLPKSFNLCNVDLFDGTFTLKNGLAWKPCFPILIPIIPLIS